MKHHDRDLSTAGGVQAAMQHTNRVSQASCCACCRQGFLRFPQPGEANQPGGLSNTVADLEGILGVFYPFVSPVAPGSFVHASHCLQSGQQLRGRSGLHSDPSSTAVTPTGFQFLCVSSSTAVCIHQAANLDIAMHWGQ